MVYGSLQVAGSKPQIYARIVRTVFKQPATTTEMKIPSIAYLAKGSLSGFKGRCVNQAGFRVPFIFLHLLSGDLCPAANRQEN